MRDGKSQGSKEDAPAGRRGEARGLGFPLLCDFDRPKVFSILLDLLGTSSTIAGSSAQVSALLQLIAIAERRLSSSLQRPVA